MEERNKATGRLRIYKTSCTGNDLGRLRSRENEADSKYQIYKITPSDPRIRARVCRSEATHAVVTPPPRLFNPVLQSFASKYFHLVT